MPRLSAWLSAQCAPNLRDPVQQRSLVGPLREHLPWWGQCTLVPEGQSHQCTGTSSLKHSKKTGVWVSCPQQMFLPLGNRAAQWCLPALAPRSNSISSRCTRRRGNHLSRCVPRDPQIFPSAPGPLPSFTGAPCASQAPGWWTSKTLVFDLCWL